MPVLGQKVLHWFGRCGTAACVRAPPDLSQIVGLGLCYNPAPSHRSVNSIWNAYLTCAVILNSFGQLLLCINAPF